MRKQKSWLDRLSAAARWRLGAKEAGEVIADYREIIGDPPRPEEELIQELGKPLDAVKPLTDPKAYRLWLAVFAVMAGCILMLGISPLSVGVYLWQWLFYNRPFGLQLGPVVAAAGAVGAVVWFRWKGYKTKKLPRAVLILLVVLVVWLAVILGANWAWMHDLLGFAEMWGETPARVLWWELGWSVYRSVALLGDALEWGGGLGMTIIGIFALVKARTEDQRWAAVYVLAMTSMLVCLEALALLSCMTITGEPTWESYFSPYFYSYAALTAIGLIGTGVALC